MINWESAKCILPSSTAVKKCKKSYVAPTTYNHYKEALSEEYVILTNFGDTNYSFFLHFWILINKYFGRQNALPPYTVSSSFLCTDLDIYTVYINQIVTYSITKT